MATKIQVTMDCHDPIGLARFWASALGYRLEEPPAGHASWDEYLTTLGIPEDEWDSASGVIDPEGKGPRIFFQQVPESKSVKNRIHLDLDVSGGWENPLPERRRRIDTEADRLAAIGATIIGTLDEYGGYAVTMRDPEGNEFDLH